MAKEDGTVTSSTAPENPGRKHHYPALDGLRGFALLAVFTSHYDSIVLSTSPLNWSSWLGVDVFFVLSGFLITGILFDSLGRPNYFRNFYIRRALRIFPLYYSIWIAFLALTPWLHPVWSRFDIARVFYYGNLMDFSAVRHPEIDAGIFLFFLSPRHPFAFSTGHLWSLCLEEQFYLVWPLLIFLLKDRKKIMQVCAVAIFASLILNTLLTIWCLRHGLDRVFLYNATYTHASPMLFGAWLGLWMRGRPAGKPVSPVIYSSLILLPLAVICVSLATFGQRWEMNGFNPVVTTYGYTCSGLLGSGLLLAVIQQDGLLKRIFSFGWLTFIGTISYGLYVIHGFLVVPFKGHFPFFVRHGIPWLMPVAAFIATLCLAKISYHWIELPFLRLKNRFAPTRPVSITGRDPMAPSADPVHPSQSRHPAVSAP